MTWKSKQSGIKARKTREITADRAARGDDSNYETAYRMLVEPILKQRPEEWENQDWLEYIFLTKYVTINNYKVKSSFSMPGALVLAPGVRDYAAKADLRKVTRGMVVCVRKTELDPDKVEIEIVPDLKGSHEISYVFETTAEDYNNIRHHFEV
jgi:hypothetical protein